jgi:dimethylhistidine N-methyltransferase
MREGNLATFVDLAPVEESFREVALAGLSRPDKAIPCRFLYDNRGSELFDEICELSEYYITRTEIAILEARAGEIAALAGPRCQLIEFGSGAGHKVRILLAALADPRAYIPIDISPEFLRGAASRIVAEFPALDVVAVCADFAEPQRLPEFLPEQRARRVGFFPGSTIGNLRPDEAVSFLRGCRTVLGLGGGILIGVDLKKDPIRLHDAYNDAAGVTAAFTLNLLGRMNREIGADFDVSRFDHEASYNAGAGRIEIYIRSRMDQIVRVAGRRFRFAAAERLHVEYSYKYTVAEFQRLARRAGFEPAACWTDAGNDFSVHYLTLR